MGVPTPKARVAMLEQNMLPLSNNVSKEAIKSIAETLHGFVAADIYGLAQAAAMRVMTRYVPPSALQLGTLRYNYSRFVRVIRWMSDRSNASARRDCRALGELLRVQMQVAAPVFPLPLPRLCG